MKEEEYSDVEGLDSSDGSEDEYVPATRKPSTSGTSSRRSSIKGKQRARYIETDDEADVAGDSGDEDQLLLASEASGSCMRRLSIAHATCMQDDAGQKHLSGVHRTSAKHARPSIGDSRQPGSAKKRKLDTDSVTARKTQSKALRKV